MIPFIQRSKIKKSLEMSAWMVKKNTVKKWVNGDSKGRIMVNLGESCQ